MSRKASKSPLSPEPVRSLDKPAARNFPVPQMDSLKSRGLPWGLLGHFQHSATTVAPVCVVRDSPPLKQYKPDSSVTFHLRDQHPTDYMRNGEKPFLSKNAAPFDHGDSPVHPASEQKTEAPPVSLNGGINPSFDPDIPYYDPPPPDLDARNDPRAHMNLFSFSRDYSASQLDVIPRTIPDPSISLPNLKSPKQDHYPRMPWSGKQRKQRYTRKDMGQLHFEVLQMRVKLQESRMVLRQNRLDTLDKDVRFAKALRTFITENQLHIPDELLRLCDESVEARTSYQPLEDDYNDAEDQLDRREYRLSELEKRFYESKDLETSEYHSEPGESVAFEDSEGSVDSAVSTDAFTDYPPILLQLYSRVGDMQLLRERLENLRNDHAMIVQDQLLRASLHHPLAEDAQAFLDNFDNVEAELLKELAKAEAEAEDLRKVCAAAGLLADDRILDGIFPATHPLLASELSEDVRFSDLIPESADNRLSRSKFVNRWLLGHLRASLIEIQRLTTLVEAEGVTIDQESLKLFVLECWSQDGAANTLDIGSTDQIRSMGYDSEGGLGKGVSLDEPGNRALVEGSFGAISL